MYRHRKSPFPVTGRCPPSGACTYGLDTNIDNRSTLLPYQLPPPLMQIVIIITINVLFVFYSFCVNHFGACDTYIRFVYI